MRYFLCPGKTDMRKGMSSLCGVIHERMELKVWMETEGVKYSSSSLKRKAITYAYKRWD